MGEIKSPTTPPSSGESKTANLNPSSPHPGAVSLMGNVSPWMQILTLLCIMLGMLFISVALAGVIGHFMGGRELLLANSVVQNITAFFAAAVITARIYQRNPWPSLAFKGCKCRDYLLMTVMYCLLIPSMNYMIEWNAGLHLPASMEAMEQSMREMEDAAKIVTDQLLSTQSVGGLIVNVLVIGVLTGICEEVFFRGALQRMLQKCMPGWMAVICAALFFSLMHFQFFGFVPRFILGAFLGWLLLRSNSIWLSATAHALNNSLVVITTWITARGCTIDFERIGMNQGWPWIAILTGALYTMMLYKIRMANKE